MPDGQESGGEERWIVVDARRFSWIAIDTRLLADDMIDAYAGWVYCGLVWHARTDSGEARCGNDTLAGYAKCSLNRARQAVRDLVRAGYVKVTERPGKPNLVHLVDMRDMPAPAGPSPWTSTPPPGGGVERSSARANSQVSGGPQTASEGPLTRADSPEADPPTPPPRGGVLSTTPPARGGDPSTRWRGTTPQNERTTPLPPAGFDAHRAGRNRSKRTAESARDLGADQGQPDDMTAAVERARTLAATWARVNEADRPAPEDLAARIRRDCMNAMTKGAQLDVDAVVAAGLAVLLLIQYPLTHRHVHEEPPGKAGG